MFTLLPNYGNGLVLECCLLFQVLKIICLAHILIAFHRVKIFQPFLHTHYFLYFLKLCQIKYYIGFASVQT